MAHSLPSRFPKCFRSPARGSPPSLFHGLTTTGSPVLAGLVAFAELLPYVVVRALAGPLIDRIGAKPLAVASEAASMVVVALIPLLNAFGVLSVELLIPIMVVKAFFVARRALPRCRWCPTSQQLPASRWCG